MPRKINIAYAILAHKYPEMLARLIERLSSPYSDFFIHVDKRQHLFPFKTSLKKIKKNDSKIKFVKRCKSPWGSIGLVNATLNSFSEIAKSLTKYDYIVTLSGQDYPLVKNNTIRGFFEENYGNNYISYFPCVYDSHQDPWKQEILTNRLGKYHINLLGSKYEYPSKDNIFTNIFLGFFFDKPRTHVSYVKPYADSQWFCITMSAVRYILNFVQEHPDFLKYHKYTYIPDEIFFQTILLNSPDTIRESIVNDNLKYIDWSKPNLFHPLIFSCHDFSNLMSSKKIYARKFDLNICSKILDMIDDEILESSK
ncbi:MAG: beta-1,6-N-acetylglucosaminyltransferase [Symploca sp. SIO3E6]|nr:beta-1,6-N-acetylglucosaminyltransferase [Caldora sp. SIO3E6]